MRAPEITVNCDPAQTHIARSYKSRVKIGARRPYEQNWKDVGTGFSTALSSKHRVYIFPLEMGTRRDSDDIAYFAPQQD